MKKPTIAEIQAYIIEKNLNVDAKLFFLKCEERARENKDGSTTWMRGRDPMKRWRMCLQIHHQGGWCRTRLSDKQYHSRNEVVKSAKKREEEKEQWRGTRYADGLRALRPAALKDKLKDGGAEAQRNGWLIREILAEKKVRP